MYFTKNMGGRQQEARKKEEGKKGRREVFLQCQSCVHPHLNSAKKSAKISHQLAQNLQKLDEILLKPCKNLLKTCSNLTVT
jgi:hypothetical protein